MTPAASYRLIAFITCSFLLAGCGHPERHSGEEGEIIAVVGKQELYLSELEGMMNSIMTREDSVQFMKNYAENWVREQLLFEEAESHIGEETSIDKLVNDYKQSLILHKYLKEYLEEFLDTLITPPQLEVYYEQNKSEHPLESPILRCTFIRLKNQAANRRVLEKLWDKRDDPGIMDDIKRYCEQNADFYILDSNKWYKWNNIEEEFVSEISPVRLKTGESREYRKGQNVYFVELHEYLEQEEPAPLAYIEELARKAIMHNRKKQAIESLKESLYDRNTLNNRVKIFIE